MKQVSKILLLLSMAVLVVGCKLAVIVVEGGEVLSTGSGTCVASNICIVDVSDPNFSETFTAVPSEGWYFQRWNSGDRLFCGGSTDPSCTLSFQGHEESKYVEDMVASSEMFYLMPVFKESSNIVVADGKGWLQPVLFLNLSWNDIDAACPMKVCGGLLNGHDMTGWTWASSDDAESLFTFYNRANKRLLDDFAYTHAETDDSERIMSFALYAMLSDPPEHSETGVYVATVYEEQSYVPPSIEEFSIYPVPVSPSKGEDDLGAWFWRSL